MSFLTSQPDLSKTIFNNNDLHLARKILQATISRENPPWLKKPLGILGEYWKGDDPCFLIELARTIDVLEHKIADKSIPRLYEKVSELLRPLSTEQFIEKMTELQVALALVDIVCSDPLAFLKSEDIIQPKVSRCPDFAFQTLQGVVLVEATVFHGGILDVWTQSAYSIITCIQDDLFKHNRKLSVRIALPLKAEMDAKEIAALVINEMGTRNTGEVLIGDKGTIEWEPFPIITLQDSSSLPADIAFSAGALCSPGVIIDRAFSRQIQIAFSSEEDVQQARELVLKSLRMKLREKRGQFFHNETTPCLIAMRLEHDQLGEGDIVTMLQERIWPNEEEYSWLSGMLLFRPRSGFSALDDKACLSFYQNPKTFRPVSDFFRAIFNGNA